jgi:ADP-ribose pyrophosphatase
MLLGVLRRRISSTSMAAIKNLKCRNREYQGNVARAPVPDDKVSWTVEWPDYKPVDYTSPHVLKGPLWADPDFSR